MGAKKYSNEKKEVYYSDGTIILYRKNESIRHKTALELKKELPDIKSVSNSRRYIGKDRFNHQTDKNLYEYDKMWRVDEISDKDFLKTWHLFLKQQEEYKNYIPKKDPSDDADFEFTITQNYEGNNSEEDRIATFYNETAARNYFKELRKDDKPPNGFNSVNSKEYMQLWQEALSDEAIENFGKEKMPIDLHDFEFSQNEKTNELKNEVIDWVKNKYGIIDAYKNQYFEISVYALESEEKDTDNYLETIYVRIADHSLNPNNIERYEGSSVAKYLSVVIANKDATESSFNTLPPRGTELEELFYGEDAELDAISVDIENQIDKWSNEIRDEQEEQTMSANPDIRYASGGIPDRYKKMGFEEVGEKRKSSNPEKKWMVLAKKDDQYRVVHGGHKGMEDFVQHKDEQRRGKFWQRMGGRDSVKARDKFSPLYWHKKFGTWENGGVLDENAIKVAWVDSDTPETFESKMFDNIKDALKYADGKTFVMMQLEEQGKDDYYKWTLLPYGQYDNYLGILNWGSKLKLFEEGGKVLFASTYAGGGGIDTAVQDVLSRATVDGKTVILPPGQLDRKLYTDVAKALEIIGGKWNRKAMGFTFLSDPAALLAQLQGGVQRNIKKELQFFPTPALLADRMVEIANIQPTDRVLEPSAGQGAIVSAIHRIYPQLMVDVYELSDLNQTFLRALPNVRILGSNFLEGNRMVKYDVIIANPPFSKNQDIEHIRAMYERLKPNGKLVTIASKHWQISSNRGETEFKEWVTEHAAQVQEVPANTFKASGTSIPTVLIELHKYGKKAKLVEGWEAEIDALLPEEESESDALKREIADTVKKLNVPQQDTETSVSDFLKIKLTDLTKSLPDFQGRSTEYASQTYNRVVNEAASGALNISAIPPIQIWKDVRTGSWVILNGHSRTVAFSDLATGKKKFAPKYKAADFAAISAQVVHADTLEEAKRVAKESNQGAVQTALDNAWYWRSVRLAFKGNKMQLKQKCADLYGSNCVYIDELSHLNPGGKLWHMLTQTEDMTDREQVNTVQTIASYIGSVRMLLPQLTNAHENELYDWLIHLFAREREKKKTKQPPTAAISSKTTFRETMSARVSRLDFNPQEPLNLFSISTKTTIEETYDQEVRDMEQLIKEKKKEMDDKRGKLQQLKYANDKIEDLTDQEDKYIIRLQQQLLALKQKSGSVTAAAKTELGLFDNPEPHKKITFDIQPDGKTSPKPQPPQPHLYQIGKLMRLKNTDWKGREFTIKNAAFDPKLNPHGGGWSQAEWYYEFKNDGNRPTIENHIFREDQLIPVEDEKTTEESKEEQLAATWGFLPQQETRPLSPLWTQKEAQDAAIPKKCRVEVRIAQAPNGKWAFGTGVYCSKSGKSYAPSIDSVQFANRKDAFAAGIKELYTLAKDDPDRIKATRMLQEKILGKPSLAIAQAQRIRILKLKSSLQKRKLFGKQPALRMEGGTASPIPYKENTMVTLVQENGNLFDQQEAHLKNPHKIENALPADKTKKYVREIDITLRNLDDIPNEKLDNSRVVADLARKLWDADLMNVQEQFFVLLLNKNLQVIGYDNISKGSIDATVVDPGLIVGMAAKARASSVVVLHNHPSGNLRPSDADIRMTKALKEALLLINVLLNDHLIITSGGYYSFADQGMMKEGGSIGSGIAMYDGPSHDAGGIPVTVGSGTSKRPIEVEGDEYKICEEAYNSNEVLDFKQKTNLEVLDSIHKEFSCKFEQSKADSGDFIICKRTVLRETKRDRKGTVKEIINQIQEEGGCKVEYPIKTKAPDGGAFESKSQSVHLSNSVNANVNIKSENFKPGGTVSLKEKAADLLTLPDGMQGTNCANCRYMQSGFCAHPQVQLPVTRAMCCALWDSADATRTYAYTPAHKTPAPADPKKPQVNQWGGYDYAGDALARAKSVDLITLPVGIDGTNCGNCLFFTTAKDGGYCFHPALLLPVRENMNCKYWNTTGAHRSFKEGGQPVTEPGSPPAWKTWFIDIDGTIVKHKSNVSIDAALAQFKREYGLGYEAHLQQVAEGLAEFTEQDLTLLDEQILPNVSDFFAGIPDKDMVILTTARQPRHEWITKAMLRHFAITNYDLFISGLPSGARVVVNDNQPNADGTVITKAFALPVTRNAGLPPHKQHRTEYDDSIARLIKILQQQHEEEYSERVRVGNQASIFRSSSDYPVQVASFGGGGTLNVKAYRDKLAALEGCGCKHGDKKPSF